ncbi:MAG: tRNA uridine-5-carboxymethylaminomethyl(34) synthesis GTPase MnmE, partial [Alphaproteobacteria bacterium]|nr:tRNA uridine-5-carboxymethylaminomethyl(34) synthesis GTPase MnmE [Alphaproteobacteria bacterium]
LARHLEGWVGGASGITRLRHRQALTECAQALERMGEAATTELRAEELRLALRALGRVTGEVDIEEVLDIIFRDFCVGK